MFDLIDRLAAEHTLDDASLLRLIQNTDPAVDAYLAKKADTVRRAVYGTDVYIRGLIEVSSFCKNDCLYCGIRRSNTCAERYRLDAEQILACVEDGYPFGFRTFVLQGGEDAYYTDERLCDIIQTIKTRHPDCAVTLSLGERDKKSYQRLFDAGADRYLLRHETADKAHYERIHPASMSYERRMQCLRDLKAIGYQTGCGFMVGSPYQTPQTILADLRFIEQFQPEMCGIGPFIPHHDTPFAKAPSGSVELTLRLLSMVRLMLPSVLLPATTALNTVHPQGRERGILAGANVVMPNLSPSSVRKAYSLYDHKISTGDESAQSVQSLKASMQAIGYTVVVHRGDHRKEQNHV